jgi:hypothetical protein
MKFLFILWSACACAQSGIEVPAVGTMIDSSGAMRPVQGVAGNFWLGPVTASGVLSAACSERLCLAKTDSKILSATGETDAPPGPAIFGLSDHDGVVFFSETGTFARWHGDTLDPLDWTVNGEVLSIRLRGAETDIAVRRRDRRNGSVSIVRPDGSVVDWVAATSGPVLLLKDGVLFATGNELVLRRQDASETRFEFTGAESITAMSPHYAAIRAGSATYALRTESGRESLFLLPANPPANPK